MLAFGWNQSLDGASVIWAQARQGAHFVYLGADSSYQAQSSEARAVGLKVGGYYTLDSDINPQDQAALFLGKLGPVLPTHLPPAVFVKEGRKLATVKDFVEAVELTTKRKTLIGGTPRSLAEMGLTFGRTNPLWISHKPAFGGPSIPKGWADFALWQTPPPRPYKGVSKEVGFNVANTSFIDPKRAEKVALGLGALAVGAGVLYYWLKPTEGA